jgi:hypothetical protein
MELAVVSARGQLIRSRRRRRRRRHRTCPTVERGGGADIAHENPCLCALLGTAGFVLGCARDEVVGPASTRCAAVLPLDAKANHTIGVIAIRILAVLARDVVAEAPARVVTIRTLRVEPRALRPALLVPCENNHECSTFRTFVPSLPWHTRVFHKEKRLKLRLPGSARKSQKRFRDTPRFKFQAVLARTQPFLSRSVEKRGDQTGFLTGSAERLDEVLVRRNALPTVLATEERSGVFDRIREGVRVQTVCERANAAHDCVKLSQPQP